MVVCPLVNSFVRQNARKIHHAFLVCLSVSEFVCPQDCAPDVRQNDKLDGRPPKRYAHVSEFVCPPDCAPNTPCVFVCLSVSEFVCAPICAPDIRQIDQLDGRSRQPMMRVAAISSYRNVR